jgi:putative oxidoreductase
MFTIHIQYGFSAVKTIGLTTNGPVFGPPGYEINLVYIAGLAALILLGSGRWSADSWLFKRAD